MDHSLRDVIKRIKLGFSFNARFDPRTNTISTPFENDESKTDGDKKDSSKKKGETPPVKKGETPRVRKSKRLQDDDHKSSDCLSERLKDPQTKTLALKL
jgi:hypothetical protein